MSKSFGFGKQLGVGDRGEEFILKNYHIQPLHKIDGKSKIGDFFTPDGKIIEIKTDTYPMERTPNFFMEYYSNREAKTLGGPWRAYQESADLMIYLYLSNLTYFEFNNIKALVVRLDNLIKMRKLKPIPIPNRSWITTGYKIPREDLADLYTEYKPTQEELIRLDPAHTQEG